MFRRLEEKILRGGKTSREEALAIACVPGRDVFDLFSAANRIRNHFRADYVDICSILNAKSGACPEDCAYCAQSSSSSADIEKFALRERTAVLEKAREAKAGGAKRFCIVTSGRKVSASDLAAIAGMVSGVRALGLLPCATLGLLSTEEILLLKEAGLERFHHNVETSERFFPHICSTHTYADKMKTIEGVLSTGLSLCSGGIFGLGEGWEDRVDMALALREIGPDSVPINFLMPIRGTRLGSQGPLGPLEALKIISLYRFILPDKEIRVCGGRMQTLGEFNAFVFFAGADGLLSGDYLTTTGRRFEDDIRLISGCGLRYR
jgi:biotin synthase